MFPFLLVVHAIIAAVLVTFILMQRSEGGGLGMGGSPSGLMSARGAADFLTRATGITATFFVFLRRDGEACAVVAPAAVPAPVIDPGAPPAAAPNASSPASPPDNAAVPLAR